MSEPEDIEIVSRNEETCITVGEDHIFIASSTTYEPAIVYFEDLPRLIEVLEKIQARVAPRRGVKRRK